MNLLQNFKQYIQHENLFQPKDKLLLAVSGGVDSVVLCELCKQAGYDFVIAHCNFQLRGEESERDEKFVKGLGEKYGVEVLVKNFDTQQYGDENKTGIQEAARDLRYKWFYDLIDGQPSATNEQRTTANYILTAHHADDNIETLLMNFFKGTGINGLRGILPKQKKIIRPLLFAQKELLQTFALENNLSFAEDSSNCSNKYTRNYFRNQLIPDLKKVYPQAENNLIANLHRFKEIEMLYEQSVEWHKKKLLEQKGNEIHIPVLKLLKTVPLATVLYEIIKDAGFTAHQTDEAIALLKSETGKYIKSSTHRIIKNRSWLIISPIQSTEAQNILIEEADKNISFEGGDLKIEKHPITNNKQQTTNNKQQTINNIAELDAAQIKFPLLLRKWKQGDYFYPLGMVKKKKINRFLSDQKLSLTQKENTWVIEMDKKIVWVVGMRIDDRFKIIGSTKNIYSIVFTHSR